MWALCAGLLGIRGLLAAAEAALYGTSDIKARELLLVHKRRGPRLLRLKTEREATSTIFFLARLTATVRRRGSYRKSLEASK